MFLHRLKNADGGIAAATWLPVLVILAAASVLSELNESTADVTDRISERTVTIRIGPAIPLSLAQVAAGGWHTAGQGVQVPERPALPAGPDEPTLMALPSLEERVISLILRVPTSPEPLHPTGGQQPPNPPMGTVEAVQSVMVAEVYQGAAVEVVPPRLQNGRRIVQWLRDAYDLERQVSDGASSLTLTLMVDASGRVRRAHALDAPDPALEAMAVAAAQRMRFHPALREGQPIPAWVNQRIVLSEG